MIPVTLYHTIEGYNSFEERQVQYYRTRRQCDTTNDSSTLRILNSTRGNNLLDKEHKSILKQKENNF